jgi:FkbM family methyltransferase
MIANTQHLFSKLLSAMKINVICDLGSMNGQDALAFRAAAPRATIFAFEPSPENLRLMRADSALREQHIEVVPLAVTHSDGHAEFFVVRADYSTINDWRGMSSLHRRPHEAELLTAVPVETTRLDTFFADKRSPGIRVGLWVDVEGKSYEAIEGASGLVKNIQLLHVEVETSPYISADQKLYPEVHALLGSMGFAEVATDGPHTSLQFNALFVRRDLSRAMSVRRHLSTCQKAANDTGSETSTVLNILAGHVLPDNRAPARSTPFRPQVDALSEGAESPYVN